MQQKRSTRAVGVGVQWAESRQEAPTPTSPAQDPDQASDPEKDKGEEDEASSMSASSSDDKSSKSSTSSSDTELGPWLYVPRNVAQLHDTGNTG